MHYAVIAVVILEVETEEIITINSETEAAGFCSYRLSNGDIFSIIDVGKIETKCSQHCVS